MRMFCKRRFEDQRGASVLAVVIGLLLTCGGAKALADEELREWSDTTGRHKLTARLQAFSEDTVTLEMANGKLMEIGNGKLSTKDRHYVLTHRANLKEADDNPFKEKNAAKLEKLEAKLEESQRQVEVNARAASENATKVKELEAKFGANQRQVDDMAQQLILVKLRAAAARVDALLLDQQFSKVETSCLEEQVRFAEDILKGKSCSLYRTMSTRSIILAGCCTTRESWMRPLPVFGRPCFTSRRMPQAIIIWAACS